MVGVAFIYRYYDNGGCDHSSPANAMFPANGSPALNGNSGQCLSAPVGANWTTLELALTSATYARLDPSS
ncbi:hypothetical protein BJ912DRAFT_121480 [Pholiota molesta]|nr:hypothetical protein BJ912DRAFT_121480 [Pholiota molesta]